MAQSGAFGQQYNQPSYYGEQQQATALPPSQAYEYLDEASGQVMVYDPANGMSYTPEQYQQLIQQQSQPPLPPPPQQQHQHQQPQYQQPQQPTYQQQPVQQWGEPQAPVFQNATNSAAYGMSQHQQQPQFSSAAAPAATPKAPAAAPSRIDPKQIPRPAYTNSEPVKFFTRAGACPPPSNSNFVAIDEGNASPRFMRLTCNHIPSTPELVDASRIAVGAVIQPLANVGREEEAVPAVDFGPAGPLRCSRCKAYVNPFFKFTEGGRSFVCNMCDQKNEGMLPCQSPMQCAECVPRHL